MILINLDKKLSVNYKIKGDSDEIKKNEILSELKNNFGLNNSEIELKGKKGDELKTIEIPMVGIVVSKFSISMYLLKLGPTF